ncbi:PaeR7I family type II restriction endonuclease [Streptomyces sp. Midd1]|uniref:PaeR7I family type II restriction endonuclease n=1 Tax=Streptomyces sp. Midd3 TaxID=3161191 RepID=UPI0034DB336B
MPVDRGDLEAAITSYWQIKEAQARRAREKKRAKAEAKKRAEAMLSGDITPAANGLDLAREVSVAESMSDGTQDTEIEEGDSGTEGSVRGGKQFDPIVDLVANFFRDAGYPESCIQTKSQLEVPGFYRPQKKWDVVVTWGKTLVAAFELKALGGPSYGNNFNNRVEEAVGSATDVRRAFSESAPASSPWLGYFFLMEDDEGSRRPVRTAKSPLPVDGAWEGLSYQERGRVFSERLVSDSLYDTVCYVTVQKDIGEFQEPLSAVSWDAFSTAITKRIEELRRAGVPETYVPSQTSWTEETIFDGLG